MKKSLYKMFFVLLALLVVFTLNTASAQENEDLSEPAATFPPDGQLYFNTDYTSTSVDLYVEPSVNSALPILFKLYAHNGDLVAVHFINSPYTSAFMQFPGGVYTMKIGTGDAWYGLDEAFGEYGYYEILLFGEDETEVYLEGGYEYTLSLDISDSEQEGDDVGTDWIGLDDF